MRVVAGSAGGRLLRSPEGDSTRPTPERVREAVFNALFSIDAIDGAVVADLYAGSGAMGIEALSRGAAHVHFVEADRDAAEVIMANVDALGLQERSTVITSLVDSALECLDPAPDLVIADPPYAFDDWEDLLTRLADVVAPDAIVVAESGSTVEVSDGWEKMRDRTYGGTVITFAARITPRS